MIIIGELINASRNVIAEAIEIKDTSIIQKVALDQAESDADYIDVNAGIFVGKEPEYLKWLVQTVQEVTEKPCAIDSPDPKVIEAGLAVHKGIPMINSISLEKDRYEALMPVLAGTDLKVVALCMSDEGMPETVDDRMAICDKLVNGLVQNNVPLENIYVDPLVQPVSVNERFGLEFLHAIVKITETFQGIHTVCGLSNISYGLPNRKYLNQTFMVMAIYCGLDAAIMNPTDKKMMAAITSSEAMVGKDKYMGNYLAAFRSGLFED